eukprot:748432-Hanusia_phi.AAC.5
MAFQFQLSASDSVTAESARPRIPRALSLAGRSAPSGSDRVASDDPSPPPGSEARRTHCNGQNFGDRN